MFRLALAKKSKIETKIVTLTYFTNNTVWILIGGYVVNVMRAMLLDGDKEFRQIKPLVQNLVEEGKVEILEDYEYEGYFANYKGHVYVMKRLL